MKLVILITTVALSAWGMQRRAAGDAQAGKEIYDRTCKGCHGARGEGNPVIGNLMNVKFRHLGSRQVQAKSDEQLAKDATTGTDKSPKRTPRLSDQEVNDVIAFVRTLKPN